MLDLSKLDEKTLEEYNNLSEEEKQAFKQILEEYSNLGISNTLDSMYAEDYKEIPVDIITFIKDDRYLGRAWHLPDGKCKLFPYWETRLFDLFPNNIDTACNNVILSGARGLGKSEIAVTIGLYLMYRLMCLKDPYTYLNLKSTEQVAFAFMNITEALAYDIGVTKFQNTVQASPWFMERGVITGKSNIVWNPPSFIKIIVGSQSRHVIGQAIYYAFFDEISFIPTLDIEKQKQKAIDMIDTAIGGMKTRFTNHGKNPTVLVLASSKRSDKSFLEEHIKKKLRNDGENTFLVDEPVWNIRPASEYLGIRFKVAQGNRFLASEIIPDDADIKHYIDKGHIILDVTIEYRNAFEDDIDRALCDYAGVSSSDSTKYISGARLSAVKRPEFQNPFTKDIIETGNAKDDLVQYYDFFDSSKIPEELKSRPLFVHLDMSVSGDRTGIAGVWIVGKKPPVPDQPASKELFFRLAFSTSIKAPKGHQVSFEKNRQFIYWLREQGFNIKGVSTDSFQSTDTGQSLAARGYNYSQISMDRVSSDHINHPYQYFKNTIYEERIEMYDSQLLTEEILQLERLQNGKIEHSDGGKTGSKDISDAVAGALYNASQHAEEFAFDYAETYDTIVNTNSSGIDDGEQILNELTSSMISRATGKKVSPNEISRYIDSALGSDSDILIW